jgi:hypothetical protein
MARALTLSELASILVDALKKIKTPDDMRIYLTLGSGKAVEIYYDDRGWGFSHGVDEKEALVRLGVGSLTTRATEWVEGKLGRGRK